MTFFIAITFFQKNPIAIFAKNVSFCEFLNFIFSKNVIDLGFFIFYNYKPMRSRSRVDILKHVFQLKSYCCFFQNNISQRSLNYATETCVRMYPVTNVFLFQHQRHPVMDAPDRFYCLSSEVSYHREHIHITAFAESYKKQQCRLLCRTRYTRQTLPTLVALIIAQLLGKVKVETRNRPLKGNVIKLRKKM